MMVHDTIDSASSVRRTATEIGVAVASRFRTLVASARLADAPTLPCACNSRARYELPSVRNRASANFECAPLGQRAGGESPRLKLISLVVAAWTRQGLPGPWRKQRPYSLRKSANSSSRKCAEL